MYILMIGLICDQSIAALILQEILICTPCQKELLALTIAVRSSNSYGIPPSFPPGFVYPMAEAAFAGADPDALLQIQNKDLAVTGLSGMGALEQWP